MEEAKRYFKQRLSLVSDKEKPHQKSLCFLGYLAFKAGEYHEAYGYFKKLSKHYPSLKEPKTYLQELEPLVKASINFLVADLKITKEGNIKILEIGSGQRSSSKRLGEHASHIIGRSILNCLREKGVQTVCFNSPDGLEPNALNQPPKGNVDCRSLSFFENVFFTPNPPSEIGATQYIQEGENPLAELLCESKVDFDQFCRFLDLGDFRPETYLFSSEEAKKGLSCDFLKSHEKVVVKPADLNKGQGVCVMSSTHVSKYLQKVFASPPTEGLVEKEKALRGSLSPLGLFEEKIDAMPFECEGEHWDPTYRAYFLVGRDNGEVFYHFIDASMKLASTPIGTETESEACLSEVDNLERNPMPTQAMKDWIQLNCQKIFVPLFKGVYSMRYQDWRARYVQHEHQKYHEYGLYASLLLGRVFDSFNSKKAYEECFSFIEKQYQKDRDEEDRKHDWGKILSVECFLLEELSCENDSAVVCRAEGIMENPETLPEHRRRIEAMCEELLRKALAEIENAPSATIEDFSSIIDLAREIGISKRGGIEGLEEAQETLEKLLELDDRKLEKLASTMFKK